MAATTDPNTSQGKEGIDTSNTSQTHNLPDKEDVDVIDKTLLDKKSEYEKAIEIREQLPKDNPENQNELATAYYNLEVLQIEHLGDYDSAKSNYEKAIAIREQLPKDNPEYQNALARVYNNLADLQEEHLNDYNSAKSNFATAITIREQLPKDNPEYQYI
ncbi:MAG: tetratricopeptide repeat protein, partial [Bacteroidales bacterium]|nr:tetratricopeptide repeat protein [Bacteroidales bacterium]